MRIVILAGGFSTERNVSLSSSTLICKALRENGHQAVLADAFLGIPDVDLKTIFETLPPLPDGTISEAAPNLAEVKAQRADGGRSFLGPHILELCAMADLVFIGLHGACGEDGRLQAALDLMGIPYTGSGFLGAALAMDKDLAKQLVSAVGVKTPQWKVLPIEQDELETLSETLLLPCAIKVHNGGSSLGVYLPKNRMELQSALREARQYGDKIIWEQFVEGREFSVGVLEEQSLPPIEIIPKAGFYDYKNKYQPGATLEICPAELTKEEDAALQKTALLVHKTLGLGVYSRCDFILDASGNPWFLEVNTLPGMTPTSLLPQEAAAVGISYHALCERIVNASLKLRET